MDWLLLVTLGIIWGIFLLPSPKRRKRPMDERNLEALAHIQEHPSPPGRWVLMPRQDERLIGTRGRAKARIRERRRRVLAVLGEAIAFTLLIGAFPPLRAMWVITGILTAMGAAYVFLLIRLRTRRRVVSLPDSDLKVVRTYRRQPAQQAAAR
jgi:hypothetical protein